MLEYLAQVVGGLWAVYMDLLRTAPFPTVGVSVLALAVGVTQVGKK